jgi:hypothetical protein
MVDANLCSTLQLVQNQHGATVWLAVSVIGIEYHAAHPNSDWSDRMCLLSWLCCDLFACLQVQFVTVAYSELSLMTLMSQGLHALPVLQVNANVGCCQQAAPLYHAYTVKYAALCVIICN